MESKNSLRLRRCVLLAACCAIFLAGCQNPLRSLQTEENQAEMGTLSLTIGGQGTARTILPQLSPDHFARFHLEFTPSPDCDASNGRFTVWSWQHGQPIELAVGIWDLRIDAFTDDSDSQATAQGELSSIRVTLGETIDRSVALSPVISGEGTFSWWGIHFPQSVVSAYMEIAEWVNWNVGEVLHNVELVAWGTPVHGKPYRTLPAGQYIVIFTLYSGWDYPKERVEISKILHVYRNLETELATDTFADFVFPISLLDMIFGALIPDWTGWRWNFADAGITWGHFALLVDGVREDNFADIVGWFDVLSSQFRPPSSLHELKILVDAALIGIASNDVGFRNAGNYQHMGKAEVAITELARNGTAITFDWTAGNDRVTVGIGPYTVQIIFSDNLGLLPPPPPGASLTEHLAWLRVFADSNETHNVVIGGNEVISLSELPAGRSNLTITLSGSVPSIIRPGYDWYGNPLVNLFNIGSGVTLVLNYNITLQGSSRGPLVRVNSGGTLIMNYGTRITGNTNRGWDRCGYGGGVYVSNNGIFVMNAGVIHNNSAIRGGGVYVSGGGIFTMNSDGIISGNSADNGGGVYFIWGVFTMNGGRIYGNTASMNGGGVFSNWDNFRISDGIIYGNDAAIGFRNTGNGAALFAACCCGEAQFGTSTGNTFTQHGWVGTSDLTIEMENGVLIRPATTITVTFDTNNGSGSSPGPWAMTQERWIGIPGQGDLWREGYRFAGWNTAPDGSGEQFWERDSFLVYSNVTLYAVWIPLNTVTFNANNGSGAPPAPWVSEHQSWRTLPGQGDLWREGYRFAGWNTAPDGSGEQFQAGASLFVQGAIILYAVWRPLIIVTFDANNGSGSLPDPWVFDYESESRVTIPLPGDLWKAGYYFFGWNTMPDGSGTEFEVGTTVMFTSRTTTLYAQWSTIHTLADRFAWLRANAQWGGTYTIDISVYGGGHLTPEEAALPMGRTVDIILMASEPSTISLASNGSLFTVGGNWDFIWDGWDNFPWVTLVLGNNVTLQGRPDNISPLVIACYAGTLIMNEGSKITGNTNNSSSGGGGGVSIGDGSFIMNGGVIYDNTAWNGGGVCAAGVGWFYMNGGVIYGNTAWNSGGGVRASLSHWSYINGGVIFNNTAWNSGGGVYGIIRISNGVIYGIDAEEGLRNIANQGAALSASYWSDWGSQYGCWSHGNWSYLGTTDYTIRIIDGIKH